MTRRYAFPFRTALPVDIDFGAWHYERESDVPIRIEGSIPGWDYLMGLRIQREVAVRADRLRASCGIGPEDEIIIAVTILSPQSRYRASHFKSEPLKSDYTLESIHCEIDGAMLAGSIFIDTEIILTKGAGRPKAFLAHLPGSRLYSERVTVELEGSSSRMPVEVAKFSEQLGWLSAHRAPWYVSCEGGNLHAPVMKALRVYLNSEETAFTETARRADPVVVTLLGADTTRLVLLSALSEQEFLDNPKDYSEGTLGEVAARLLSSCFPGYSAADVKAMADHDGGKFDAAIKSFMNVTPRV
jgi:hypothetical protein